LNYRTPGRFAEVDVLLAETAQRPDPQSSSFGNLIAELEKM
jgi:hypothetical protein